VATALPADSSHDHNGTGAEELVISVGNRRQTNDIVYGSRPQMVAARDRNDEGDQSALVDRNQRRNSGTALEWRITSLRRLNFDPLKGKDEKLRRLQCSLAKHSSSPGNLPDQRAIEQTQELRITVGEVGLRKLAPHTATRAVAIVT